MRDGYAVTLPSGKVVDIVAPTVAEVLIARRAAGSSTGAAAMAKSSQAALRVALRKVDGKPYGAVDEWPLSARDTMLLARQIATLTAPGEDAVKAARAAVVVVAGERETWTATLPSGRTVALSELGADGVFDAMAAADAEGAQGLAGQYRMVLDGLRRSITAISGKPAAMPADVEGWPFSPVETDLLGVLWMDLHGLSGTDTPTMVPTTG